MYFEAITLSQRATEKQPTIIAVILNHSLSSSSPASL